MFTQERLNNLKRRIHTGAFSKQEVRELVSDIERLNGQPGPLKDSLSARITKRRLEQPQDTVAVPVAVLEDLIETSAMFAAFVREAAEQNADKWAREDWGSVSWLDTEYGLARDAARRLLHDHLDAKYPTEEPNFAAERAASTKPTPEELLGDIPF